MSYLDQIGVEDVDYDIRDIRGDDLALIDGYYEDMTVGDAEQLVATVGVEDKIPYNFRTAGGSADIGDRLVDKIVGGTIAWNQQLNPSTDAMAANGGTKTYDSTTKTWTITQTTTSAYIGLYSPLATRSIIGHKYFISGEVNPNTSVSLLFGVESSTANHSNLTANAFTRHETISCNATASKAFVFYCATSGLSDFVVQFRNIMIVDLTQMFGSTIANYIASLESSTPGSGVTFFRSLFPKPYYAYNAGQLMSICTNAHKTIGFNQWDEETESGKLNINTGAKIADSNNIRSKNYIPVVGGATYYFHTDSSVGYSSVIMMWYDANKGFISYSYCGNYTVTAPANARFALFYWGSSYGTTYKNDTCFNLHWDGERDGEYEPYNLHTYALDDVELRGIPKLDSNNKLYYDGDEYASDGTVTRNYGIIDLGTLTWTLRNDSETRQEWSGGTYGLNMKAFANSYPTPPNFITTSKFVAVIPNSTWKPGCITYYDSSVICCVNHSEYADGDAFAAAVSGTYLVYELATPTTESADPYTGVQIVDDFGTEEYVDALATAATSPRDVAVPVGHDSFYRNNLRAKLEMAPNSPESNGDYIVRHNNGVNSYVAYENELPTLPSEDGTYSLKVTVSGSTKTLSWVADT